MTYRAAIRRTEPRDRSRSGAQSDEERIRIAVAGRAGALKVNPAPGGRRFDHSGAGIRPGSRSGPPAGSPKIAAGSPTARSKRSASPAPCRRRQLLDHFGDQSPQLRPAVVVTYVIPSSGCPTRTRSRLKGPDRLPKSAGPPPELAPRDEALYEDLRRWRLRGNGRSPAYHVASNHFLTRDRHREAA